MFKVLLRLGIANKCSTVGLQNCQFYLNKEGQTVLNLQVSM